MHIPDGYLSPSTCAVTFAMAAPFWYVASRKVKTQLHTKLVPLMAVVSAFSFVVMMFNLPLPGGTTGHAVGLAIAAIVLGPWAAVLAISIALLIQAVLFGDGGITAIGANCLNMAIVGPFAAWAVFRLVRGLGGSLAVGVFCAASLADLLTYVTTSVQLAWAFPDPAGGFMASFAKFAGIFAVTQIPLAISEGLLTVLIFNALARFNPQELKDMNLIDAKEARA